MRISEMRLDRLDDWLAEKGHHCNVRLSATGLEVQCMASFPVDHIRYHCVSGSATGLREDAPSVIESASVACRMAVRAYHVEAEVRAEVERRMLEQASTTERAAHDAERDARGAAGDANSRE